jgi:hypothetical protein
VREVPPLVLLPGTYIYTRMPFLLYIKGEPRPAKLRKDEYRANQPAGLKLIFALLCRPTIVGAQYRELARFARVALGTVGPILKDLARRGYLRTEKTTKLLRTKELLQEWVRTIQPISAHAAGAPLSGRSRQTARYRPVAKSTRRTRLKLVQFLQRSRQHRHRGRSIPLVEIPARLNDVGHVQTWSNRLAHRASLEHAGRKSFDE